jgi:UDP-MurNAc hydroxylase
MKIEWYTNACVRISALSGASIVCDPWVNGGAFLGSWFHWPPISEEFGNSLLKEPCDGIYISHLHPDHYDPKFINAFSKARPEVPIYIAEFAHSWLKRSLQAVTGGRSKIVELPTLTEVEVAPGLSLKIFAADTCNPLVCGVSVPCQVTPSLRGIDSIGVFSADGFVVVNANDAMGVRLIPRIAANIGKADLLMGHYGGASPFPQCFPEVKDKKSAARKVVETACNMLSTAADALDVKYVMPFAGQYVLGGKLSDLNGDRATVPLDEAVGLIKSITNREVISMNPNGYINLSTNNRSSDYIEPDSKVMGKYLSDISIIKFPYEELDEPIWDSFEEDLLNSATTVAERSKSASISFKNSFVIGDGNKWVTINLDPNHLETSVEIGKNPKFENVTEISMPSRLLLRLSTRKSDYKGFTTLHWNQADTGSHFMWKRSGEFDLASHSLLNFYGV